jgi:transcriptional regulator of acetoin/glycerol metabolism
MGKHITGIPDELLNTFKSYSWPGNIRELQNLIERAVVLANDGVLPNPLRLTGAASLLGSAARETFRESDRIRILRALENTGWRVGGSDGAAARLGLNRTTLISRMKKHGIFRPPAPG